MNRKNSTYLNQKLLFLVMIFILGFSANVYAYDVILSITGNGTISWKSESNGDGSITCPGTCSQTVAISNNRWAEFSWSPAEGYEFDTESVFDPADTTPTIVYTERVHSYTFDTNAAARVTVTFKAATTTTTVPATTTIPATTTTIPATTTTVPATTTTVPATTTTVPATTTTVPATTTTVPATTTTVPATTTTVPATTTTVPATTTTTIVLAPNTYLITASAGTGGTISPSGSQVVSKNSNPAYTITADSGYTIVSVMVDTSNVYNNSGSPFSYTFPNVTASHTITANFAASTTTGVITTTGVATTTGVTTTTTTGVTTTTGPTTTTTSVPLGDNCVFRLGASDQVPPNIVMLLDTGADMEFIITHSDYTNPGTYTPIAATGVDGVDNDSDGETDEADEKEITTKLDIIENGSSANGFWKKEYAIVPSGQTFEFTAVKSDRQLPNPPSSTLKSSWANGNLATFTVNGKTVTLLAGAYTDVPGDTPKVPAQPYTDKASQIRYTGDYLNWLFFHKTTAANGGTGTGLSTAFQTVIVTYPYNVTRYYWAKRAIADVLVETKNDAQFNLFYFGGVDGATPIKNALSVYSSCYDNCSASKENQKWQLEGQFYNNLMGTMSTQYASPLAEALEEIGGFYNTSASHATDNGTCAGNYVVIVTPGFSSYDDEGCSQDFYPVKKKFQDYDGDNVGACKAPQGLATDDPNYSGSTEETWMGCNDCNKSSAPYCTDISYGSGSNLGCEALEPTTITKGGVTYTVDMLYRTGNIADYDGDFATDKMGSMWLDDVAFLMYKRDVSGYSTATGFQNVKTYVVGVMPTAGDEVYMIKTSNQGNGVNDFSSSKSGKYYFSAQDPTQIADRLKEAISAILTATSTFTAPVVPVTRTTSGDKIYMAFFKPSTENFWEGNVTKFGIDSSNNQITDKNGARATQDNGAMIDGAPAFWETKFWAGPTTEPNYMLYSSRKIYTYLEANKGQIFNTTNNVFDPTNSAITAAMLGNPTNLTNPDTGATIFSGRDKIMYYIQGRDVLDEDGDGDRDENREIITGDVLHSEPVVVKYKINVDDPDSAIKALVLFGGNDGMLHAVCDTDDSSNSCTAGEEAWGFIPPDQLNRLKYIVEGTSHTDYVDSSPKIYIDDKNHNRMVDLWNGEKAIVVCGSRKGGYSYFALDITARDQPKLIWRISSTNDAPSGTYAPKVLTDLGQSWSEPTFGKVKTTDADTTGVAVTFIGGGYSSDNSAGKAVIVMNVLDPDDTTFGTLIFKNGYSDSKSTYSAISGMDYCFPTNMYPVDRDGDGFIDKLYAGDTGGNMWRFGKFRESNNTKKTFPGTDGNINNWTGQKLFNATHTVSGTTYTKKFFYAPSMASEKLFDLIFMGTGNREDSCNTSTRDGIFVVKDDHNDIPSDAAYVYPLTPASTSVVDVTSTTATPPNLDATDYGWYIILDPGEKILSEGTVFHKVFYIGSFVPNDDKCVPGGEAYFYALSYKTGAAAKDFNGDGTLDRRTKIGGGIPSKPVMVITPEGGEKLLVSIGSGDPTSGGSDASGILSIDPVPPGPNFHDLWWFEPEM